MKMKSVFDVLVLCEVTCKLRLTKFKVNMLWQQTKKLK